MNSVALKKCLACGNEDLDLILDLGDQPPANNLRDSKSENVEKFPLAVNLCKTCCHLQLTEVVSPDILYKKYLYVSGTSATYLRYMKWYANFCQEKLGYRGSRVLDIGCNDGSQLNAFKEIGFETFGVDPAQNLFELSSANHNVKLGYWNQETISTWHLEFDIISSQNAFAHIPEPLEYLSLVKRYLSPKGKVFISTSQADMVLNNEFDTIYHEHISFYNAESMRVLAQRAGLCLINVVKTPIHGTSYIFILGHDCAEKYNLENILNLEKEKGLQDATTYLNWAKGVNNTLNNIQSVVQEYKNQGYVIVGYGAAAKGMTLITAGQLQLDMILDDNSLKQNKWCPGVDVQIISSDYLIDCDHKKILFIPLAWNLFLEIRRQIRGRRNNENDRFLKYFPKVQIL